MIQFYVTTNPVESVPPLYNVLGQQNIFDPLGHRSVSASELPSKGGLFVSMHCTQQGSSALLHRLKCEGIISAFSSAVIFRNGLLTPGENKRPVWFTGVNSSFWIYPSSTQVVPKPQWNRYVYMILRAHLLKNESMIGFLSYFFLSHAELETKKNQALLLSHSSLTESQSALKFLSFSCS